jgi:hypothetical protein
MKPCPKGVSETVWLQLDDETREVWEELPKHVRELIEIQQKQVFWPGLTLYYLLFVAICLYAAAWQAGYSPLWFLGNIWRALTGAR